VERSRWTDERHDDRMTVIDGSFDNVFEELRAGRARAWAEMRAERAELRTEMRALRSEIRDDMPALNERLRQLDERLGRIGFRAAGILATGLIALVATQL
jgi:uncharacterized caspase-like protein